MKRLLIASFIVATSYSGVVFSSDYAVDKCKDFKSKLGYATHVIDLKENDVKKLGEYCEIYFGIKNKEPEYINKALNPIIERSNGLSFLKDINFEVKSFDSVSGDSGLGFSYDYNKTNSLTDYKYDANSNATTGLAWNFSAKGNVSSESDINPKDFLDTRLSLTGFRDYGGVSEAASKSVFNTLNDLEDQAWNSDEGSNEKANALKKIKELSGSFLSTQTYLHYDLNAGLESNQNFTEKQWSYGAKLALDIKGYGNESSIGKWNVFDYPFALIRRLTGYGGGDSFRPLGSTFPTFVIGLDQVDPVNNTAREALGEEGKFGRTKAEVYFRTPIGYVNGEELFVNYDYRIWREVSPSAAIESSCMDEFLYRTLSITSSNGVFVSYSKGKLPFDLSSGAVYELGWKFHFD